jgi:FkbM family methyltransferase
VAAGAFVWGIVVLLTGGAVFELGGLRLASTHAHRPLWIAAAALAVHSLIAGLVGLRADVAALARGLKAGRQALAGFVAGAAVVAVASGTLGAEACGGPPGGYRPLPALALSPALLHDEGEIRDYVNAFPREQYTAYHVRGIGRFFIDDRRDLIKGTIASGRPWERHIVDQLKTHIVPGTAVVEVGAHIGTHTVPSARLVGPWGRVYAFEPQRKIYRELHHNLALNGVTNVVALRFALGAGDARIVEMNPAVPENEGGTGVGAGGDRVELRSLDSFGFERVSLVKIDAEHFENEVLSGAVETIRRNRPVVLLEIMGGVDYETAPPEARERIHATWKRLEDLGYAVRPLGGHDYIAEPYR